MIRAIRDAMSRLKSMGNGISMTWTGNKGVGVRRRRHSPKWRHIGKRRVRIMKKLDESKVRWIIRESRRGTSTGTIAKNAGISARWVQKLCRRYAGIPIAAISYPGNLGRPRKSLPGRREHSAVLSAVSGECSGAVSLESVIERATGMHIPHKRHTHDIEGRGHRRGAVQKGQAPQVDTVRAHPLQLHVAHRLQAAARRQGGSYAIWTTPRGS